MKFQISDFKFHRLLPDPEKIREGFYETVKTDEILYDITFSEILNLKFEITKFLEDTF